ncbi:hypothetical protein Pcinc_006135 [Petrolisthes cinctipes]|uniref:VIT domain-containing protein n=1 Tax=Petrolisthes cinctipes TaxID=88211 RepID=A0AAE1GC51_PETCI|nr:hypothetical protein Pcinc_006135 [Petrolisthes cinctipes]
MSTTEMQPQHFTQWGMLGTYIVNEKPLVRCVELESVRTKVTVRGFVAQVRATLVYHNLSPNPLQVKCVFPVEDGAAFYKFEARLDGRTIIAQCMEKKKAEKVYKDAVSEGKTAVLAREHEYTSDILQLALGNLPSGERAEIEVSLVMELCVRTDGGVSFILPTVLNPRYSPADLVQKDSAELSWNDLSDQRTVCVAKAYSMNIEGSVCGSHQIARIISHTDPINVTISDDTKSAQLEHGAGIHAARNQHHHLTTQISPSKMKGSPADHLDNKFTSATSPNSYVTNSIQE